jgi:mannose-6-phosphate isomerase
MINRERINQTEIFAELEQHLTQQNFGITKIDTERPWGGFFVLDEQDAEKFIQVYFPQLTYQNVLNGGKLSPKLLVVAPNKRLSWQYHHRRAEIWKLIGGKAKIATSDDDHETEITTLQIGDIVQLNQGKRHRLIGDENVWGVVAEIWIHTDDENPSDEDDIVRIQDDFGR